MGIQTDSTPLEEPKNPDTCNVYALYELIANTEQIAEMRKNYEEGNYGYGHAKQALYDLLVTNFAEERQKFNEYMADFNAIDDALAVGKSKATSTANVVLQRVRKKLGY